MGQAGPRETIVKLNEDMGETLQKLRLSGEADEILGI